MAPIRIKPNHSPHKRTKIVYLKEAGVKAGEIAEKEGISKHAIYGIVRRYRSQQSARDKPRSGRPTVISERDKNHIFRIVDIDPFISTNELIDRCGLRCHRTTLTGWLRKRGIKHHHALRRPLIGPDTAEKRLNFAQAYVNEDTSFWHTWIFSDEASIQRGDGEKTKWVFCPYGERLKRKNVQGKRKPIRHGKMFFGAFSLERATELVPLEGDPESKRGGVTARIILDCLKQHLPELVDEGMTFQHDNGSTFTAKITQNWLKRYAQREGLILVNWPPYSPDLNPIENLWAILKDEICKRYPELGDLPKNNESLEQLIEAACEVWADIEEGVFENLINSMPDRMQAVIDNDGWYTKY